MLFGSQTFIHVLELVNEIKLCSYSTQFSSVEKQAMKCTSMLVFKPAFIDFSSTFCILLETYFVKVYLNRLWESEEKKYFFLNLEVVLLVEQKKKAEHRFFVAIGSSMSYFQCIMTKIVKSDQFERVFIGSYSISSL